MAKTWPMVMAVAAVLAACAAKPVPAVPVVSGAAAAAFPAGVIVALRPLPPWNGKAPADARGTVLSAIGVPSPAAHWGADEREFVVRTDGGGTLSVVQRAEGLIPGQRVEVLPGDRLRPLPAGR